MEDLPQRETLGTPLRSEGCHHHHHRDDDDDDEAKVVVIVLEDAGFTTAHGSASLCFSSFSASSTRRAVR